jgi:hypothetical protein
VNNTFAFTQEATAVQSLTTTHTTDILTKQDLITTLEDLTCNSLNTKNISRLSYFDTIVIRRVNETTTDSINLRELQTWVNGVNIMVNNGLTSYFALWSDKETDKGFYLNYDSTFVYNDIVLAGFEAHSPANLGNALIIKNIPLTSINEIQALIYYNRTGAGNTPKQ